MSNLLFSLFFHQEVFNQPILLESGAPSLKNWSDHHQLSKQKQRLIKKTEAEI